MQLADDNAFRSVDDKCSAVGHVRQVAEVHHFLDRIGKIFSVLCFRGEPELCLQRHGVRQPAFLAFAHRVLRLLDIVLDKLEKVILARVGNGKIHEEHLLQTLVFPLVRRDALLQKMFERFHLDVQQIGVLYNSGNFCERNTGVILTVCSIGLVFQCNHSFGSCDPLIVRQYS